MSYNSRNNAPVPRGSKRACLCRDGSYSIDCCDGDYFSQGIGSFTNGGVSQKKRVLTLRSYGNGSVSPTSVIVDDGSTTTITATADNGYVFSNWNDGNTDNPRTITATESSIIYAKFIAKSWSDDFTMSKMLVFGTDGATNNPIENPNNSNFSLFEHVGATSGLGYSVTATQIETLSNQNTDDGNIYDDMTIEFGAATPSHIGSAGTAPAYLGFTTTEGYIGLYVDNNNFILLQATNLLVAGSPDTSNLKLRVKYIRGAGTIDGTTNKIQVGMTISTFGT